MSDTVPEWLSDMPTELQESKNLTRLASVEDLARSYEEQYKVIGGSIRLPGEDDESKSKFADRLSQMGYAPKEDVPETYELNGIGEEDPEWMQKWFDGRKTYYKDAGLTQKQAEKALELDQKLIEEYQDDMKATTAALKEEYGADLPKLVENAQKVIDKYELQDIANSPFGATPQWNKLMIEIGKDFTEDGKMSGSDPVTLDTEALKIEEAELNAEMSRLFKEGKMTPGNPEANAYELKRNAFLAKKQGLENSQEYFKKNLTVTKR